jgi:hypothetical protein
LLHLRSSGAAFRTAGGIHACEWVSRRLFCVEGFNAKDKSCLGLFASPEKLKPGVIALLLKQLPTRKFIPIGDAVQSRLCDFRIPGSVVFEVEWADLRSRYDP